RYADLLSPLAAVDAEVAAVGLELYEGHARLSPLDALLAALVVHHRWRALVSAHRSFATVKGLRTVDPGTSALDELLGQPG
ncbi:MAG: hypothetical protein H0U89_11175, partial [Acidimicrobiia bacterium]|nr:hypothetical protein [Acidimicrobiia bacterium]